MNQEQIRKEWQRIEDEYKEAEKKYNTYKNQFFTKITGGKVIQEARKYLTKETLDEIIKLREKMYKKSKELWDFAYSIACSKS